MNISDLKQILDKFLAELQAIEDLASLEALRVKYLGAKSAVKEALRAIKTVAKDQQKAFASAANELAQSIDEHIRLSKDQLKQQQFKLQVANEWQDLSLPGTITTAGMRHPIQLIEEKCLSYLALLGFELITGNDIETAFYNFDALNIPPHHPARDMQDTFWLNDTHVLRTHTTAVQARILEQGLTPPIKHVVIGRVYRNEAVDATHLPMFHQLDGFWLEAGLTLAHLKGITTFLAKKLYGDNQQVRIKPKYYPYTEPSVGIDIECHLCQGQGCGACHDLGWVTIMGAGMIHPHVLTQFGYDPTIVSGIAFGWGISRMTAQFYKLNKLRPLYAGDMRLLQALNGCSS
jgi:phenylalanyl-tRNA synthetase alpha chain